MGYVMIELSENKLEKLSDYMEKGLSAFGKAMTCVEELQKKGKKSRMHERYGGGGGGGSYGNRYGGGGNMGQRDDDDWDDEEEDDDDEMNERYQERRGVKGTGRYSRYRYRR